MSGNTIPPKPPLPANYGTTAAQSTEPKRTGRQPPADREYSVGPGANREKAQSAVTSIKNTFTALFKGLKSVVYEAAELVKPLGAYVFKIGESISDDVAALEPKKAMKAAANAVGEMGHSFSNFLNSNSMTKEAYRSIRDWLYPPKSDMDAGLREAKDAAVDMKKKAQEASEWVKGWFK